tara:strand:+ start:21322 stop:22926 length:1605 start_codon:yes stop_codon:yes gene_type:complete
MNLIKTILKALHWIYPLPILVSAITPIIINLFVDYNLFDSRLIIINLAWISIFSIPIALSKNRFVYLSICSLFFTIGFIETIHWIILKGPITTTSLLVVANTNMQESIEFLDLKGSFELLILVPYTILFLYLLKRNPTYSKSKNQSLIVVFILILSVGFISENALKGRLVRKGIPTIAKVTFSFIEEIKLYQEVLEENHPLKVNAQLIDQSNKQTVILVIGESTNRNHLSLYGSKRKTTPRLDKRADLTVFKDVVSPYSNTINSVLTILSESNLEENLPLNKSVDAIDIFHSAGFKTFWISNQSPVGVWDNLVTVFAKKSDHCDFVNLVSNSSFESTLNTSLDEKLFSPFQKSLSDFSNNKLIILHLMGNHSKYKKRYPSNYEIFQGEGDHEETIAAYDNSVLYNDFIVDSLIRMVEKKENESISLIYLSDHGENVYDEDNKVGHDFVKNLPKSHVEIPFIVWLSDKYKRINPEKLKSIKNNKDTPFVTDNLFHCLMDLSNIKSSYFKPKKSIFNKNFDVSRKRILEDGRDYDQ